MTSVWVRSVVYWPSTRPNMPFQSDAPEGSDSLELLELQGSDSLDYWSLEVIPMTSNRKKLRRRIWLTKWDKVKAHDTLIDWCTGREWLLNCMTVIPAWWRSNVPFQRLSRRLSGWLNYYITIIILGETGSQWVGEKTSWRSDKLETRCGRESQHKAAPPGLRLSIRRTRKTQRWWP